MFCTYSPAGRVRADDVALRAACANTGPEPPPCLTEEEGAAEEKPGSGCCGWGRAGVSTAPGAKPSLLWRRRCSDSTCPAAEVQPRRGAPGPTPDPFLAQTRPGFGRFHPDLRSLLLPAPQHPRPHPSCCSPKPKRAGPLPSRCTPTLPVHPSSLRFDPRTQRRAPQP